jgi:hypothetical protein
VIKRIYNSNNNKQKATYANLSMHVAFAKDRHLYMFKIYQVSNIRSVSYLWVDYLELISQKMGFNSHKI